MRKSEYAENIYFVGTFTAIAENNIYSLLQGFDHSYVVTPDEKFNEDDGFEFYLYRVGHSNIHVGVNTWKLVKKKENVFSLYIW